MSILRELRYISLPVKNKKGLIKLEEALINIHDGYFIMPRSSAKVTDFGRTIEDPNMRCTRI